MNMNDNIMYILRHSFLVSSHFQISGLMHYSTARFGSYCCVYFRLCYAMRIQKWDYLIVVPLKVRLFFSKNFFSFLLKYFGSVVFALCMLEPASTLQN